MSDIRAARAAAGGNFPRFGSELKVHRPSGQTDVIWGDSLVTGEEVGGLEEKKKKKEGRHGLKRQSHSEDEVLQ